MTGGAVSGLVIGLRATVSAEVTEADTAAALGSGDLPVLGTPRLVALAEAAAVAAVAPLLTAGQTTVGTSVSVDHCLPTGVGARIDTEAELIRVDGRRLVFSFTAREQRGVGGEVVGTGTVQRVVVDAGRFLARVSAR